MNLEALLGELRDNVLRDNSELASGPNDQLWSDETLVRYINAAQQRFARKTLSLRDASTPEVVQVTLAAGVSSYVLHEKVLAVVSGKYDTDTVDLARIGRVIVTQVQNYDPPWFDPSSAGTLTPGRPRAISTDETLDVDTSGAVTLTVYPAPSSTEVGKVVYLRTARLPMDDFDVNTLDAECELPEMYQLDMLEWAAYLALRNSDIDGHSTAATDHESRFNAAVAEVLKDVRRKMRAPVKFNFGRGGFTWETI
jgi:hypothetical protein